MRKRRSTTVIAVAVLSAELFIAQDARSTTSIAGRSQQSIWMADVAERAQSLRERTERAADEARARRVAESERGEWWRNVAVQPQTGRRR